MRHQAPFFEFLVWVDLGLNPSLLLHWRTPMPIGIVTSQRYIQVHINNLKLFWYQLYSNNNHEEEVKWPVTLLYTNMSWQALIYINREGEGERERVREREGRIFGRNTWFHLDWLILMACQPVRGCFIPRVIGIVNVVVS